MAATTPNTGPGINKNSGWLRYLFDSARFNPDDPTVPGIFPSLGAGPVILQCMSGHAGVAGIGSQPDIDNQLFGETPGHDAIVPVVGSLFAGLPATAVNQEGEGSRGSGLASARIPEWQKTRAFFVQEDTGILGAVAVQTEVVSSQRRIAGALEAATSQRFLASLRVALSLAPVAPGGTIKGMLFVEVQHTMLDLPGTRDWSQVPIAPPG